MGPPSKAGDKASRNSKRMDSLYMTAKQTIPKLSSIQQPQTFFILHKFLATQTCLKDCWYIVSKHGRRCPPEQVSKEEQGRSCNVSYDLALEVTLCHFCNVLLVTQVCPCQWREDNTEAWKWGGKNHWGSCGSKLLQKLILKKTELLLMKSVSLLFCLNTLHNTHIVWVAENRCSTGLRHNLSRSWGCQSSQKLRWGIPDAKGNPRSKPQNLSMHSAQIFRRSVYYTGHLHPTHERTRLKNSSWEPRNRSRASSCFRWQRRQIFQFESRQINCVLDTNNSQEKKNFRVVATHYIQNPAFDQKLLKACKGTELSWLKIRKIKEQSIATAFAYAPDIRFIRKTLQISDYKSVQRIKEKQCINEWTEMKSQHWNGSFFKKRSNQKSIAEKNSSWNSGFLEKKREEIHLVWGRR